MKERFIDIKVGFFVFLGVLLICVMILLVGSDKLLFKANYTLYCKFPNIMGLQNGAGVRLAGYNIGTVSNVFFSKDPDEKEAVIVELTIEYSKREYIRMDSKATINTIGVLGDKYIEITFGSPSQPVIEPNGWIAVDAPKEITDYLSKVGGILNKIDRVISFVDDKLETYKKEGTITKILNNLVTVTTNMASITEEIRKGESVLGKLVYDTKQSKDFSLFLSNLKNISFKLNSGKGTFGALINDPTLYEDLKTILSGASRSKTFKYVIRHAIQKSEELKEERKKEEETALK
ncbi:MAG: MCE family protein [Deltaproteobacteria bacterium]|nr:MCE family protein [Deltaproteobacteria bacterium]